MGFSEDDKKNLQAQRQDRLLRALHKYRIHEYDVSGTKKVVAVHFSKLVSHQSSLSTLRAISARIPKVYSSIATARPASLSVKQWLHLRESRTWQAFEFLLNRWFWSMVRYHVELKTANFWIRARYIVEYQNLFFVITLDKETKREFTFLMKPNKRLQRYINYLDFLGHQWTHVSLAKLNATV